MAEVSRALLAVQAARSSSVVDATTVLPPIDRDNDDESVVDDSPLVPFSESQEAGQKKLKSPAKRKKSVVRKKLTAINLTTYCSNISHAVVRECLAGLNWREVNTDDCSFWWIDSGQSTNPERYTMLGRQKINYFPAMNEMCKKKALYRCLKRLRRTSGNKLFFFPPTYVLPEDWDEFREQVAVRKPKTFIVKPDAGCQGAGIYLVRTGNGHEPRVDPNDRVIIQRYIHRPLLIDDFKFDFRVYILVTSVDPLRSYIFNDGLARFCTRKYSVPTAKNVDSRLMHLTNYSLNKFSENFQHSEDYSEGSKRSLDAVLNRLAEEGKDIPEFWRAIHDLVNKTLISMYQRLWFAYHSVVQNVEGHSCCFQILGFDVLLDHRMRPWLLEINHHPSLNLDEPIDRAVKGKLLFEGLTLIKPFFKDPPADDVASPTARGGSATKPVRVGVDDVQKVRAKRWAKHNRALRWEDSHLENYARTYPNEDLAMYETMAPWMRQDVMAAFEIAARTGERMLGPQGGPVMQGIRGLNGPKFMRACKELGLVDNGLLTRHDVDMAYIDASRGNPNPERGMDYGIFFKALTHLALRRYPDAPTASEAVNLFLQNTPATPSSRPPAAAKSSAPSLSASASASASSLQTGPPSRGSSVPVSRSGSAASLSSFKSDTKEDARASTQALPPGSSSSSSGRISARKSTTPSSANGKMRRLSSPATPVNGGPPPRASAGAKKQLLKPE
eukprot:CAMPEP_0114559162 /NCGR_PEP_ID=MMETSP0114-20121206/10775_1 /TAXON_ID=31324 /ORGANISM="Goniomonas sp, Strain m" /LENGTH=726 /DNA_ID=CAMNT_0001744615 /DNA_START=76 /DNA_END=2256 /DNA_ORIENTATION=+